MGNKKRNKKRLYPSVRRKSRRRLALQAYRIGQERRRARMRGDELPSIENITSLATPDPTKQNQREVPESKLALSESQNEQIDAPASERNCTNAAPGNLSQPYPALHQPEQSPPLTQPEEHPNYIIRINPMLAQLIRETNEKVKMKSEILFKEILEEKIGKVGKFIRNPPRRNKYKRTNHDYDANFPNEKSILLEEIQALKLELKKKDKIIKHKKNENSILKDKLAFYEENLLRQPTDLSQQKS